MRSEAIIVGLAALFIVAALLYFQSRPPIEGFATKQGEEEDIQEGFSYQQNTDGSSALKEHFQTSSIGVPADLNKAVVINPSNQIPTSGQRPTGIPGAQTAPKDALATDKELEDLNNKIMLWLDAAEQRERGNPNALTPAQRQRRVMLQARSADLLRQLGTGIVTDPARVVHQESVDLRRENAGWQRPLPSLEAAADFGRGAHPDALLTPALYQEFRSIFQAGLDELRGHTQPEPLQKVRQQQLEVIAADLDGAERVMGTPSIRTATARLFLLQMLKPDQPLPTLFSMAAPPQKPSAPMDLFHQIDSLFRSLKEPADEPVRAELVVLVDALNTGATGPVESAARNRLVELQHGRAPRPYNPHDLLGRATTLCSEIREAFSPSDAEALGCPKKRVETEAEAETTINTVCDRLRTSVPSVSPEQFNCPRHNV